MNTFLMILAVVVLCAAIFFAICTLGARGEEDHRMGDRCAAVSMAFMVTLVLLIAIGR